MKKLFSLLFLSVMLLANLDSSAQLTLTASSNTNTNAVSQTHTATLAGEVNNFDIMTIQLVGTKVSGTPGGTAILYGSIDNTNYTAIGADTLTIANQTTNSKYWTVNKTYYKYYRVVVTTTGTQVSTWVAYLLGRKQAR